MLEDNFVLKIFHMHAKKENTIIFMGVFKDDNPQGITLHAYLDKKELPIEITVEEGIDVRRRNMSLDMNASEEIIGEIALPEGWSKATNLSLELQLEGKSKTIHQANHKELVDFDKTLVGNLDYSRIEDNQIHLGGWVSCTEEAEFSVKSKGKEVPIEVSRKYRKDALDLYPEYGGFAEFGYEVVFDEMQFDEITFTVKGNDRILEEKITMQDVLDGRDRVTKYNIFQKGVRYLKANGFKKTVGKTISKFLPDKKEDDHYEEFLAAHAVSEEELQRQRETKFEYNPVFSIVIPLYKTPKLFLKELIESITGQTYPHWQLCLADGSDTNELEQYVREYSNNDPRVCYKLLGYNDGISKNTNGALEMATGDFITFSDHDDLLTLDALYECAYALNQNDQIDCLYSDEDKIDMDGETLFMPHFKTDYNIDLLCSHNYITHLFVARKTLVDQVGWLRSEYDGSQDHDMIFRCVEQSRVVYHIPKVLYHWRCHKNSTASNPESKMYCYESGRKAVESHFERMGLPVTVEMAPNFGYYRPRYHWAESPLVSIIIPNMGHADDLKRCIASIQTKSTYSNYEIIVVENNTPEGDNVFDYYEELKVRDNITIATYSGEFNYSKINNFGVEQAKGEYLLFLNNDTELIAGDSIKEMLDICMREDVGAVGARLYYEDNTVQHAGVILGVGGVANHAFLGTDRGDVGYFFRSICNQDLSAVTAACMMTKKSTFEHVQGFTEELAVAYNDVDYCLKLRAENKLVVYTPYSEWFHYESKSRGYENTPEKIARLEKESKLFTDRWPQVIAKEDPYYSPNLNHERADYTYNLQ